MRSPGRPRRRGRRAGDRGGGATARVGGRSSSLEPRLVLYFGEHVSYGCGPDDRERCRRGYGGVALGEFEQEAVAEVARPVAGDGACTVRFEETRHEQVEAVVPPGEGLVGDGQRRVDPGEQGRREAGPPSDMLR